jgi:outer membrane lipoprotein LolB
MSARLTACLLALALSGCSTLMKKDEQKTAEANWARHQAAIARITHFDLHARVSSGGLFGIKGDLRWQQHDDGSFDVRVSGPFGIGAVSIRGTEEEVEVKTKNGTYKTRDPERWIKDRMGWTLPLLGLRHWVQGVPWGHSESKLELDLDGRVVELRQDGWKLDYQEYQQIAGTPLPRLFTIANNDVKIKVLIDRWENLPSK